MDITTLVDSGTARAGEYTPKYIDKRCTWCGDRLIEIDGNTNYYAELCDNFQCRLFRSPQGYREKQPGRLKTRGDDGGRVSWLDDFIGGKRR